MSPVAYYILLGGGALIFSSVPFLYGFLIVVIALYFLLPKKLKNLVLLLSSLFFYFYGEPIYSIIMVTSSFSGYLFGLLIENTRGKKPSKLVLWIATAVTLAPLIFFKYSDFFITNINGVFKSDINLLRLALPIGISFYTFQILSYLIDVYRGDARVQKNPISFMAYVSLFPQLIAGPIVRYQTIQDELDGRTHSLSDFSYGITRFCVGLGKKVLIADSLSAMILSLSSAADRSVLSFWVCAIAFTLQIYFDFSGYSDMAIGLGRIFGFHFLENFNYPYISKSVTEFWRRWHISLGSWFRDYVYIPMGGNRCSKGKWMFNILVVWFLTGFWHGASWNFIVWGLYFATFLLLEKLFLAKKLEKLPMWLQILYTLILVNFGFVIFNANDLSGVIANFGGMFGAGGIPLTDSRTVYYLLGNAVLLLIAAVGATPLPKKLADKLRNTSFGWVLEPLFAVVTLLLVTAYLVDGSFSPFLYFRF